MRYWSWLAVAAMILAGCSTRIDPYFPHNNGHGGGNGGGGNVTPTPSQTVTNRTDWSVQYKGRVTFEEEDYKETLEEFLFGYTGNYYFILSTISDADFESIYKSDVKSLIDGELKDLRTTAENQKVSVPQLKNVFVKTDKTKYFNILIHGDYKAFLVECDKDGKPTYNYTVADIEVKEETATQEFKDWLGVWTVSDGYVGYDIEVSAFENNYLYRVDGWETGPAAGSLQMNQDDDWIQARLIDDGTLSFFIQFIARYEDYEDLGDVDYMFVGTYAESTGEKVDDFEGWELAWAKQKADGASLLGGCSEFEINGVTYQPHYNAMHYSLYSDKKGSWVHFHDAIPMFREKSNWTISMTRTKASSGVDRTPVHTRNYLRKTQPRVHNSEKKSIR